MWCSAEVHLWSGTILTSYKGGNTLSRPYQILYSSLATPIFFFSLAKVFLNLNTLETVKQIATVFM